MIKKRLNPPKNYLKKNHLKRIKKMKLKMLKQIKNKLKCQNKNPKLKYRQQQLWFKANSLNKKNHKAKFIRLFKLILQPQAPKSLQSKKISPKWKKQQLWLRQLLLNRKRVSSQLKLWSTKTKNNKLKLRGMSLKVGTMGHRLAKKLIYD